jgi:hypothetical protein
MEIQEVNPDRHYLFVGQDVLGWKIVNFCKSASPTDRLAGVRVLLHLQIPATARVFDSLKHSLCTEFDKTRKYCTDVCRVEGLQFFGDPSKVTEALQLFQQGQGHLMSGWGNKPFEYRLRKLALEPEAGKVTPACGPGIHLYLDPRKALENYGQEELAGLPVISDRLTESGKQALVVRHAHPDPIVWPAPYNQAIGASELEADQIPQDSALGLICKAIRVNF